MSPDPGKMNQTNVSAIVLNLFIKCRLRGIDLSLMLPRPFCKGTDRLDQCFAELRQFDQTGSFRHRHDSARP